MYLELFPFLNRTIQFTKESVHEANALVPGMTMTSPKEESMVRFSVFIYAVAKLCRAIDLLSFSMKSCQRN